MSKLILGRPDATTHELRDALRKCSAALYAVTTWRDRVARPSDALFDQVDAAFKVTMEYAERITTEEIHDALRQGAADAASMRGENVGRQEMPLMADIGRKRAPVESVRVAPGHGVAPDVDRELALHAARCEAAAYRTDFCHYAAKWSGQIVRQVVCHETRRRLDAAWTEWKSREEAVRVLENTAPPREEPK